MVRSANDRFKDGFDRDCNHAILHGFDSDVDLDPRNVTSRLGDITHVYNRIEGDEIDRDESIEINELQRLRFVIDAINADTYIVPRVNLIYIPHRCDVDRICVREVNSNLSMAEQRAILISKA